MAGVEVLPQVNNGGEDAVLRPVARESVRRVEDGEVESARGKVEWEAMLVVNAVVQAEAGKLDEQDVWGNGHGVYFGLHVPVIDNVLYFGRDKAIRGFRVRMLAAPPAVSRARSPR